ncbi:fatty-acyl-CoA synthase [Planobispora rosea]|uniref:Fatty-acyl-CoA synthase n=1 Tax=Planobispora rosea TaxID=35762 RepID=A0A8J3RRR9_PLARO|nr:class I adenylate-forming enzyme family protein [Planobispora rosea]GGS74548.1 fatty-acyl-CoA synthase [Planobispora rosea]GIH81761.1 fatty-acyl-CoA synthase [Planobispora rosea]
MNDIITGIMATAGREPYRTAIIDGRGRELTYAELARRVDAVRATLAARGDGALQPGDGVLFAVRPGVDAVVTALGAVAAGGMLVLADPGLAPGVLAARMAATRPKWVITESLLHTLSGPLKGLARRRGLLLPDLRDPLPGHPVRHLYTGPWLPGVPRGALRLASVLKTVNGRGVPGPHHTDQPAAAIFTSGTTASPRGVVHTRGSLASGLELFREAFPLGPGDVVHTDQLMLGLPALMAGATWSLPGGGPPAEELAARRATHTFAVPVRLDRMLRETPVLPETLRYLLLGSAPAPAGVLRRAVEAGPEVLSVYAMTEALPISIASAREKLEHTEKYGEGDLLGAPLPGVGVRVADDGELFVSGPHLARGYLGEEPLREVATGDLVRVEDGRLVLLGRKKDMILRDGFNIYPGLYEPAITSLPGVAEAAIVGLADPGTGDEEVVLAVVPAAGYDETLLRKALPDLVDAAALPDRIVSLDVFPRSGRADKLDRAALRARVSPGDGRSTG